MVAALAQRTRTPMDVVKYLYDEERAKLRLNSAVRGFIDVIAGRRVKERLRKPPYLTKRTDAEALSQ